MPIIKVSHITPVQLPSAIKVSTNGNVKVFKVKK
jgi:hypothetical protein